jgi:hypothetical protein
MMNGLTSGPAGGARHDAGCMSPLTERAAGVALKMTPSNKRMHATRDTRDFIGSKGAGGRVMRGVRWLAPFND